MNSPERCECGPMDGGLAVSPVAVCILVYDLDQCPDQWSRLESIVWSAVLLYSTHGCFPVYAEMSAQCI